MKTLGQILKRARGERSLYEVAKTAGISPGNLQRLERDTVAHPSWHIVGRIFVALGLDPGETWKQLHGKSTLPH